MWKALKHIIAQVIIKKINKISSNVGNFLLLCTNCV